jgi:large subunit ribosomal protein L13
MEKKWFLIDAKEKKIGKVATKSANLLRGKSKPEFEAYKDCGDNVVIINSDLLAIHPKKAIGKEYFRHSGYPGGLKRETLGEVMQKDSRKVLHRAIYGMLPSNRLRKFWMKRLKIYKDEHHRHKAQKLEKVLPS